MTTVIFACVHNAGRSQMAAAFFRWCRASSATIGRSKIRRESRASVFARSATTSNSAW